MSQKCVCVNVNTTEPVTAVTRQPPPLQRVIITHKAQTRPLQVLPSFVTAPDHVLADAQPMAILSLSLDTCFDGRELLTKYIRTSAEQVSENGSTSAVAWHSFAHDFCCFFMLFYALPPGRLSDRCFFLACTFGQRHGHRPWGCQPKLARWTRLDSPGSP